jgi:TolB-like protein/aminoglycoside phosphotransferase (APT) family kinase protein
LQTPSRLRHWPDTLHLANFLKSPISEGEGAIGASFGLRRLKKVAVSHNRSEIGSCEYVNFPHSDGTNPPSQVRGLFYHYLPGTYSIDAMNSDRSDSPRRDEQPDGAEQLDPTRTMGAELINGRYLLGPRLGQGGFATTYIANDVKVASRRVVVKILLDVRTEDAWALRKFRDEVEALARIDHPNVVAVIDSGETSGGKPFLVMQYVAGAPLRQAIPREGMPLPRIANIIRQTGLALSAAHRAGVCHRDLKPENIIVGNSGGAEDEIKLIDFGLAGLRDSGATSTKVAGTWAYMAPEQFQGKFTTLSDVYQMGVLAYELATGIQPFRASTPAALLSLQTEGLKVRPKELRPELPEAAQDAILKALSPNPADRFADAREFGEVLARALEGQQVLATEERQRSTKPRLAPFTLRRSLWIAGAALTAIALFIAYRLVPATQTVAVLPFLNRGGDPEMAYISEGVTEALISDLSRIPPLRVIGHAAVIRYENGRTDPLTAGRELHVDRIIVGSVARLGEVLRIEAEMIDVGSGNRLWGGTYTRALSSLSNTLEEFSTEVTDQLRLKLAGSLKDRLKRQYATGSESYQEYLKGRFYLNKRPQGFAEATEHFAKAIAIDPAYAPAYAGMAEVYDKMAFFGIARGGTTPSAALEKSKNAAQRALELDSTLAQAYNSLGWVEAQGEYRWEDAERNFLRSLELNPNSEDAHEYYAMELTALGRFTEALREIKTAEGLAPGLPNFYAAHGVIATYARQYDASLAILSPIIGSIKDSGTLAYLLSRNYWALSRPADALTVLESLPAGFSSDLRVPLLATAYARAGQRERAKALMDVHVPPPAGAPWYDLMLAHLALGRRVDAIADLENAYQQRSQEIMFLRVDPLMDELRADQGFNALLARVNLASKRGL